MKMKKLMLVLSILLIAISCERGFLNKISDYNSLISSFKGTWISDNNADTLVFINDSIFTKSHFDGFESIFYYRIKKDSVTIQYRGPNKILVQPATNYFTLENNRFTIYLSNCAYGFDCVKKVYIKQ